MNSIKNILRCVESDNCLVKYHVKCLSRERKTGLPFSGSVRPDVETFKIEVQSFLESGVYPDNFVDSINRIYLLSETNNDLSIEFPGIRKSLASQSPVLEFSLEVFRFIREHIFHAENEYETPIRYKGFDHDDWSRYPEYMFREDECMLFPAYYLLSSAATAYFKQLKSDFENQLSFRKGADVETYRQSQREKLAEDIAALSMDFCNREIPFRFINGYTVDQPAMFGFLLSDVLQKAPIDDYAGYVTFDYRKYPKNFHWEFNRLSIADYSGLSELYGFERLVKILGNTLLLKELATGENKSKPEPDRNEKAQEPPAKPKTAKTPEYLLPVPMLNAVYEQFNGELWENIALVDFLNMFTTAVNRQDNFSLKHRQTTRFYYLLKKIWINGDQTLFNSEKEWTMPFLGNYNLSFSAYANQSIKNEKGKRHWEFIRTVDQLLPKEGDF